MSPNWKNYQGKILKHCSLCGRFNASYRVEDAHLGSLLLCQRCWSRRAAAAGGRPPSPQDKPDEPHSKN